MKLRRWQIVWTLLMATWVVGLALPMVVMQLQGDREQLTLYFGMWISIVLIPGVVVYVLGLVFGTIAGKASGHRDQARSMRWHAAWRLASIVWILLVGLFFVLARGPANPLYGLAWPLAAAAALLLALLPPTLVYCIGWVVSRLR